MLISTCRCLNRIDGNILSEQQDIGGPRTQAVANKGMLACCVYRGLMKCTVRSTST